MPFDAHTLVALVAPRPLLHTNATDDEYNNTLSIEAGIRTGKLVYEWMQVEDRCRLHWRPGKHGQTEDDWQALLDFTDEVFFGRNGESEFNKWVYPTFTPPLPWKVPGLGTRQTQNGRAANQMRATARRAIPRFRWSLTLSRS